MKKNQFTLSKQQKKRAHFLMGLFCLLSGIIIITIFAFYNQISFFVTPNDLENKSIQGKIVRLGGYVKNGTLKQDNKTYSFYVADDQSDIYISYDGALPPLFKEGQGVVLEGQFDSKKKIFYAVHVFAKHDETYMPKALVNELKKKGQWKKSY